MAEEQPTSRQRNRADHLKPFRWPKGISGNPSGRKAGRRSIKGLIRDVIDENEDLAREIVLDGMNRARNGEHKYWKDIIEIVDGKEADRIAGHDGGSLDLQAAARLTLEQSKEIGAFLQRVTEERTGTQGE